MSLRFRYTALIHLPTDRPITFENSIPQVVAAAASADVNIERPGAVLARKLEVANERRRVVLVSAPGLVQQATESTLASYPEIDLIGVAPGALSATTALADAQPELLVIDANLPEAEIQALLGWVKEHCPSVQCAVMTMTSRQRDQALTWGAHIAIHRVGLTSGLTQILGSLPIQVGA